MQDAPDLPETPPAVEDQPANGPETRLIDRRCRCGVFATKDVRGCAWHASVSASYAADLLAFVRSQEVGTPATPRVRFVPLPGALNVPDGDPEPSVMVVDGLTAEQAATMQAFVPNNAPDGTIPTANVRAILCFAFPVEVPDA